MRKTIVAPLIAALLAGCGPNAGTSPSASPSVSPSNTVGIGGPMAACAVGSWVSQSASGKASTTASGTPSASASLSGGSGVLVIIGPNGIVEVDFSAMQATTFTASAAGANVAGSFVYFGATSGQVRTADTTSLEGPWEPVGKIDYSKVKLTVDITAPLKTRVFDKVPLTDYMGPGAAQTGGAIDVDPLFGKGKYKCGGSTLTITRTDGSGLSWVLTKK